MLGSQFGKYRIEGVAGVGGMSVVYRAFDETLERIVALKVLNAQRAVEDHGVRRFQREMQIAQRLKHPHIVTIYEAGEISGRAYLAMEYMERGSLAERFAKPTAVSLGKAATLLSEIASALDYAHANGIVHRDLKLENVLVTDDDHFALSDFGIAQVLNVSTLTETGQSFGTPLYVSPEQLRGAKTVDFRTDLYSLGVIGYLLATGYFPFLGESGMAILHRHLTQEPPLPSNLNPRLPSQMDWVLRKSLAKNPQDRFASAGAQAEAFTAAINHMSEHEVFILASQPTPLVGEGNPTPSVPLTRLGGSDTVPVGELIASKPRRRRGGAFPFRLAVTILILALASILLLGLGRVLTPPPDGVATDADTPNVALVETESTPTATSTPTMTATPSPTPTATQTRTPSATPTNTPSQTDSPTRTVTETRTPSQTRTTTTASPTRTPTRTPSRTASPTGAATTPAQMLVSSPSATRRPTTVSATQAAPTSVPPTSVSSTQVPPTQVPPTQAPPTQVPPTQVPPTQVPPTSVPPTQVPPTSVPPTQVPPTNLPPPPTDPPPTGILDPIIPPVVPTVVCVLLC